MTDRLHFIGVEDLRGRLEAGPEAAIAVDCRFNLLEPDAGFRRYLEGHIPEARYAHLDRDLARLPDAVDGRHPLPAPEDFCRYLGAIGVGPETLVVAYDDCGGALAARMWWLLGEVGHAHRALLDGGLGAWQRAGFETTTRLPIIVPTAFGRQESLNGPTLAAGEIPEFIGGGAVLLDARSRERFDGLKEPIDPVAGHVPGARNLPVSELLDGDGCLRSAAEWRSAVEAVAGDCDDTRIGVMCGSGVTACMLAAALESAGFGRARLYPGSWSEWIRDPERPVASVANADAKA